MSPFVFLLLFIGTLATVPTLVVGPLPIDNKYRVLPRASYYITVDFEGCDKVDLNTNERGKIKWDFSKQIVHSPNINESCKDENEESPVKVTIFVCNGKEKRILHQFKNYEKMLKNMRKNDGRLYEFFQIMFYNLPTQLMPEGDSDDDDDPPSNEEAEADTNGEQPEQQNDESEGDS
uniref:Uncharacterized protein n=1 Tax=Globodera rostochiensis TaxID=31243 RepID=A0A914I0T0_GLORO